MIKLKILSIIILGIIQGIAEFLPISSSAHLIIFRDLFGIGTGLEENLNLTFDLALHFGTLLSIAVFFFNDFLNMIIKGFTKGIKDEQGKLLWYLIIATIPAAIAGVLFEEVIEKVIRSNFLIIALALGLMGIIIYLADKYGKNTNSLKKMSIKEAFLIGCSQVFALIPGFSRSGTTIAAGRLLGLNREQTAKFSFYLSAPIICGALLLELLDKTVWSLILANLSTFILGIVISFITGLLCIKYLLKYLQKHNFKIFMIYRLLLAAIIILVLILR